LISLFTQIFTAILIISELGEAQQAGEAKTTSPEARLRRFNHASNNEGDVFKGK